jgi:hypothetical protein
MQPKRIPIFDFVETQERNRQSLLGALCTLCNHPRCPGIPHIAMIIRTLMEKSDQRGGEEMPLLGCLPLWGREGVTLMVPGREKVNNGVKQISKEPIFSDLCRLRAFLADCINNHIYWDKFI